MFIHKNCWEFGRCCALKASNERFATIAIGIEVSENAGPPTRTMVDFCEVLTETIITRSLESSMQTDELNQCHLSSQTDVINEFHVSTETDALDQCHASAQTEIMDPCHVSTETDVKTQCHASVQTEISDTCDVSSMTEVQELDQCHVSTQTDLGYDSSSTANGSVVPPEDVSMCEKIDDGLAMASNENACKTSSILNGGPGADDTDDGKSAFQYGPSRQIMTP